jgi:hypothetical protein
VEPNDDIQAMVALVGILDCARESLARRDVFNENIATIVRSAMENLHRLSDLLRMPTRVFAVGQDYGNKWAEACVRVLGRPFVLKSDFEPYDEKDFREKREAIFVAYNELLEKKLPSDDRYIGLGPGCDFSTVYAHAESYSAPGMRRFRESCLIGVWSAFETLAADLWVEAVNQRPDSLGLNVFTPDASVSFKILRDFEYQISSRIGELARRKEIGKFDDLDKMKEAYLLAFKVPPGEKNGRPSPNIIAIFDKHIVRLRAASLVRNLLLHAAGKVDVKFKRNMQGIDPPLASLKEGADLPLDGRRVIEWITTPIECSLELIEFVDGWLKTFEE